VVLVVVWLLYVEVRDELRKGFAELAKVGPKKGFAVLAEGRTVLAACSAWRRACACGLSYSALNHGARHRGHKFTPPCVFWRANNEVRHSRQNSW
jgi:hypothetical protein